MENRLTWGSPGHTREYCLNLAGHDLENYIPQSAARALSERLPGYDICNRGSRIEILLPEEKWTDRAEHLVAEGTHEEVHQVVEALFGTTRLEVCTVTPTVSQERECPKPGCTTILPMKEMGKHWREDHQ